MVIRFSVTSNHAKIYYVMRLWYNTHFCLQAMGVAKSLFEHEFPNGTRRFDVMRGDNCDAIILLMWVGSGLMLGQTGHEHAETNTVVITRTTTLLSFDITYFNLFLPLKPRVLANTGFIVGYRPISWQVQTLTRIGHQIGFMLIRTSHTWLISIRPSFLAIKT